MWCRCGVALTCFNGDSKACFEMSHYYGLQFTLFLGAEGVAEYVWVIEN